MKVIKKLALAVFKDKKILFVRSHKHPEVFFTLGGKIEKGESEVDCLKREVMEEIGCQVDEDSLKFLVEFEDIAHGKDGALLNIRIYQGNIIGEPKASSEIAEVGWFDTNSDKKHFSEIAQKKILPWLKEHGYIN